MKVITLFIIIISSLAFASDKKTIFCIACKEKCTQTMEVKDDTSKPSKNITIWNRSMCPNFHSYGFICTKDFYGIYIIDELCRDCNANTATIQKLDQECSICFQPIENNVFLTACGHMFHCLCIEKHQESQENASCPICRGNCC